MVEKKEKEEWWFYYDLPEVLGSVVREYVHYGHERFVVEGVKEEIEWVGKHMECDQCGEINLEAEEQVVSNEFLNWRSSESKGITQMRYEIMVMNSRSFMNPSRASFFEMILYERKHHTQISNPIMRCIDCAIRSTLHAGNYWSYHQQSTT